ncbi:MAG: acyl-CoA thioesterase [Lachnospiraceae bacterium]
MKPYIHEVKYYETDQMKITHHSNYIRFMEEARIDMQRQIGWEYVEFERAGIVSPVVSVSCNYKKTTTFSDIIEIEVKVRKFSGIKLELSYIMTCDGDIVATGESEHCFMDEAGRLVNMKKRYPKFYETINRCIEVKE